MDLLTINDPTGELPESYYAASVSNVETYPQAQSDMRCDVCIVGGGFTGMSAALHAAELGLSVILLEAQRVGFGASGRNGGQVGPGFAGSLGRVEKVLGSDDTQAIWQISVDAMDLVRSLIKKHDIPCHLKMGHVTATHKPGRNKEQEEYVAYMARKFGYDKLRWLSKDELKEFLPNANYHGGVYDHGSGHLNPLKYLLGLKDAALKAGVRIFEKSRVIAARQTG